MTINNFETVLSNAEKRAIRLGEKEIVPRPSDLHSLLASTAGKIEIEYAGEDTKDTEIVERLLNRALLKVFDKYFQVESLSPIVEHFEGWGVEVSDQMAAEDYLDGVQQIPGLRDAVAVLGGVESPGFIAAASELVLEGLHLHQKLNKEREGGRYTYRG